MTKSNNLKWNFGEPQKACTYKLYTKVKTDVFPPFCIKKQKRYVSVWHFNYILSRFSIIDYDSLLLHIICNI